MRGNNLQGGVVMCMCVCVCVYVTHTLGLLSDTEHTVKNIYELVKKVIQYKDSTVKKNEKKWIKCLCREYSLTHCLF